MATTTFMSPHCSIMASVVSRFDGSFARTMARMSFMQRHGHLSPSLVRTTPQMVGKFCQCPLDIKSKQSSSICWCIVIHSSLIYFTRLYYSFVNRVKFNRLFELNDTFFFFGCCHGVVYCLVTTVTFVVQVEQRSCVSCF
jgi:hypothetical protein